MKTLLPVLLGLFAGAVPLSAATPVPAAPKLAVTIVVDQLRADYLVRFRPYFGEGGFKRLLEGGADFQNTHYRHSVTQTAPGHASIATGVYANVHGIVSNEWLDRDLWEQVSNCEDRNSPLVGVDAAEAGPALLAAKAGRSPLKLQAPTLADQLKLRYGPSSKVFTASNKDRSAIHLGGKLADFAYWDEGGSFITSTYYRKELPAWVAAFNAEKRVQKSFGKTWDRLLAAEIYDRVQGPDDAPGETAAFGVTRTFPKVITGGADKITNAFYTAFDNTPFMSEVLGQFVERALVEEKLGQHAATDFLGVSFSQIDVVGHSYGPDSHEVMDSMLRLDRVLASLLNAIERQVGLKNCVIVLTADHGAGPMPEHVQGIRPAIPAGRIKSVDFDAAGKKALDAEFGPLPENEYWFTRDGAGYHLRSSALAAKKLSADAVGRVLKSVLLQQAPIAAVFTRAEILAGPAEGDTLIAMVRRSYYAPRDRDVVYVLKPYFMDKPNAGTQHGTPYNYDTHVPQIWFGAGVKPGQHIERVGVDDIAPTFAGLLGIPAPPQTQGHRLL
jgi:predicted AlkP superfamily pyrophosphatase or phosphodiesterase